MYINFWYPIAKCDEITADKPITVEIMNLRYVAFRDSAGKAHVLSNTCVHRGGALGNGKLVDDCVQCPYHGWRFNGDGHCTRIPTMAPDQKPPARAKVDSYPVQERYGIVFAFLGDLPEAERPPLYTIEEYDDENWRANPVEVFEVNAYYERSIENGLDAAHNEFVHPAQGGPSIGESIRTHPIQVENVPPWGSKFLQPFGESTSADTKVLGAGEGQTRAGSEHHGPNTLITRIIFSETRAFAQFFFEAPINNHRTRIFFVNMRNWMMEPEKDDMLMKMNMQIAGEDIHIIESLDPVRTPDSTARELLTSADKPILRFRELLKEWEDKGWRIDQQRLAELRGDVACAIPSPGRRAEKGWVLEAVPLVPGTTSAAAKSAATG